MKRTISLLIVFFMIFGLFSSAAAVAGVEEILPASGATLEVDIVVYYEDAQGNIHWLPPTAIIVVYRNGIEIQRLPNQGIFGVPFFRSTVAGEFRFRAEAPGYVFIPGPYNSVVWNGSDATPPGSGWYFAFVDLQMRPAGTLPFTDVGATAWYRGAVQFVFDNNVMTGTTATTFSPRTNFSREQVTATLFRIQNGRPANASDPRDNPFTDVAATRWSAPYITWAFREGIVTGVTDTRFSPAVPISRQDFALVLWRYAVVFELDLYAESGPFDRFPDAGQTGSWARPGLNWAVYHGLISGIDGNLVPRGLANRAQTATILERFINTFYD